MKIIERGNAVVAVAAVAGAALLVNPVQPSDRGGPIGLTSEVNLVASSTASPSWPTLTPLASTRSGSENTDAVAAQDITSVADDIDAAFLAARLASRTDFTEFANQLGYLGKQLYIGYNFIESIVASTVFNGTDVARGEGLLRNIGQFAGDVLLSAAFVAIDEISLASPDTYPIAITRPPSDRPAEWTDALAPNRNDPLIVPDGTTAIRQAIVADGPTPLLDGIDDAFIDLTVLIRRGATPVLNSLGYIGKQLYVGLNLIESVAASAVFNSTDVLRGEGVLRNVGDFAFDVALSGLFVVIDELSLSGNSEAIAINRPPLDRPLRWEDADSPRKNFPLTVPDRDPLEVTGADDDPTTVRDDDADAKTRQPVRDAVLSQWKAKKADNAEKREQRREAREARKAERVEKALATTSTDKPDTSNKASDAE